MITCRVELKHDTRHYLQSIRSHSLLSRRAWTRLDRVAFKIRYSNCAAERSEAEIIIVAKRLFTECEENEKNERHCCSEACGSAWAAFERKRCSRNDCGKAEPRGKKLASSLSYPRKVA